MSEILGKDIYLNNLDDIELEPSGDFRVVSGNNNIFQAVKNRLRTLVGELKLNQEYGSYVKFMVGMPAPLSNAFLKKVVYDSVIQDPRITEVNSVDVFFDGSNLKINIEVQVIGSNTPLNLVYPFDLENL